MPRFQQIAPESATGKSKELLDAVKSKLGLVPNISRAMANSPAVLEGYLGLSGALAKGRLSAKNREQIALAVGQANRCDYCLAAHSAIGKMVGLTADEIQDSRRGSAVDPKDDAVIRFAQMLVENRGWITDDDIETLHAIGFDDGAICEVVANVALNIFTNYFNHVAETEIDFPKVAPIANRDGHVNHHDTRATTTCCNPTR